MASARHRRRGHAGGGPIVAGPAGEFSRQSLALAGDAMYPAGRGNPERARLAFWGRKDTIVRGFPPAMARYQQIYSEPGTYVPHFLWHDGEQALDVSQPERGRRPAQGQAMAFGFVQKGYRYAFAVADLGVAQGHPIDYVYPAYLPPDRPGTADPLWEIPPTYVQGFKSYSPGFGLAVIGPGGREVVAEQIRRGRDRRDWRFFDR